MDEYRIMGGKREGINLCRKKRNKNLNHRKKRAFFHNSILSAPRPRAGGNWISLCSNKCCIDSVSTVRILYSIPNLQTEWRHYKFVPCSKITKFQQQNSAHHKLFNLLKITYFLSSKSARNYS
jgi:hypothetical protein